MERRTFFNRLAAIVAGAAIAPRVVAEIAKELPDVPSHLNFDFTTVGDLQMNQPINLIFSGRSIAWNEKGEVICELEEGYAPRVYDIVLLQLLWDKNTTPVGAIVTAVVGDDRGPNLVHLTTLDKDSHVVMDDIATTEIDSLEFKEEAHIFNTEYKAISAVHAYRGIMMSNIFADNIRRVDPRMYPMTEDECYLNK